MKKALTLLTVSMVLAASATHAATDCRTSKMQGNWTAIVLGNFPDDTSGAMPPEGSTTVCNLSINRRGNVSGTCLSSSTQDLLSRHSPQTMVGTVSLGRQSCQATMNLTIDGEVSLTVEGRANSAIDAAPDSVIGLLLIDMTGTPLGVQWPMSFQMTRQPGSGIGFDPNAVAGGE